MGATSKLQKMMETGNAVFLNYSNYCGHCHVFMPEWKKFEKRMKNKSIKTVKIEGSSFSPGMDSKMFSKLSDKRELYFPMVLVFVNGKRYIYKGERTADSLDSFVTDKITKAAAKKKTSK